ncbi:MAG: LemA family protein [Clostridia bacterium]|nr:LemA family protein [Clostridia bacterium]
MKLNKTWIIIIAIVAALALIGLIVGGALVSGYNGLVEQQTEVEAKQADIQTQLQRRADLIPNFVATVKGYAAHEQETYTAVTEARNALGKAEGVGEQAAAANELDRAIDIWVNAVTENYPELKANQNFIALQDELAGTENRITQARNKYNEAAKEYNTAIRKFPKSLLAGMFGFEKAEYFEAAEGSENAPVVDFGA